MQCLKAAIDSHLERILLQNPEKRVVLITFSQSVTVYDGKKKVVFNNLF